MCRSPQKRGTSFVTVCKQNVPPPQKKTFTLLRARPHTRTHASPSTSHFYSKNASDGDPLVARPRGGVGGRSSLTDCIQVSRAEAAWRVGPVLSPPPLPPALALPPAPSSPDGLPGEWAAGGKGWMSLGTMTRSRPRTRMAPVKRVRGVSVVSAGSGLSPFHPPGIALRSSLFLPALLAVPQ